MTHICVGNLTIIGSDNGLSPSRHQAIIWTNIGILLIEPLGANFNQIVIENHIFSFTKIHLKMASGKWRPLCLGLNVLRIFKHGFWLTSSSATCQAEAILEILTLLQKDNGSVLISDSFWHLYNGLHFKTFQMHFLKQVTFCISNKNAVKLVSWGPVDCMQVIIGSGMGMVTNLWQIIMWKE